MQAAMCPKSREVANRTISWKISERFLAIWSDITQSKSVMIGVNISKKWTKRRNLSKLTVEFCCRKIIGGIVAAMSKTKAPLRYAFEISLQVRLSWVAVKKFKMISIHHEMSLSQTNHISSSFNWVYGTPAGNLASIISKTIKRGVMMTVVQVIIWTWVFWILLNFEIGEMMYHGKSLITKSLCSRTSILSSS